MKINNKHVAGALLIGAAIILGGAFGHKWQAIVAGSVTMGAGAAAAIHVWSKQPKATETKNETGREELKKKKTTKLTGEQARVSKVLTWDW